jgi:hypothetical protein
MYTTALYCFMIGATAWSWVVTPLKITAPELAALSVTAAASTVMFYASLYQPMSLPFTTYIMFHHLVVDAIWWPCFGRAQA